MVITVMYYQYKELLFDLHWFKKNTGSVTVWVSGPLSCLWEHTHMHAHALRCSKHLACTHPAQAADYTCDPFINTSSNVPAHLRTCEDYLISVLMGNETTSALLHSCSLTEFREMVCTKYSRCLTRNFQPPGPLIWQQVQQSYWTKVELQTQEMLELNCCIIRHFYRIN